MNVFVQFRAPIVLFGPIFSVHDNNPRLLHVCFHFSAITFNSKFLARGWVNWIQGPFWHWYRLNTQAVAFNQSRSLSMENYRLPPRSMPHRNPTLSKISRWKLGKRLPAQSNSNTSIHNSIKMKSRPSSKVYLEQRGQVAFNNLKVLTSILVSNQGENVQWHVLRLSKIRTE